MRSGMVHRRHRPALGAIVILGGLLIAQSAFAQSDGDERCSNKGMTRMFDALAKSWLDTGKSCTPPGPAGPANGEKRCGYAGYVLKYDANAGVWRASQDHCNGTDSYIGWHTIN